MRRLCAAVTFTIVVAASCCSQVSSPFTTYRHVTDHNMSTMSAVHCSSVVLVGASSKIVFGDGSIQTTAAGGGANAMQNPSTGALNMSGYGIERVAFIQAATTYGGKKISFSNSPAGVFFDERLMPDTGNTRDLGSPTFSWRRLYTSSVVAEGISIDGLIYPSNADYPIFEMSGSDFRIGQPFLSGYLYLGMNTTGVRVVGPFYAGTSGEPVTLGNVVPYSNTNNIGSAGSPFSGVFASSFTSAYFTVRSTGTRVYGTFISSRQAFTDRNGVPLFVVHYSTFESSANNGLAISTGGSLTSGACGLFIDRGTDNSDYAGNVIIGELSVNSYNRPTQGRLNVKGSFYVTNGYSGQDVRFHNSSSGNYADFGDAGMVLRCNGNEILTADSTGARFMPGLTTTASYSLMRVDTATGRIYADSSLRRYKRNITDWKPSSHTALRVRAFTDASSGKRHIGLVAEELAEAGIEELVVRDSSGNLAGVAYEKIALVLVPILHEHQARIERLERAVAALSSGTFAAEFPDGFPVGKPATEQGGNAMNILSVLVALVMGSVGVYVGRKLR